MKRTLYFVLLSAVILGTSCRSNGNEPTTTKEQQLQALVTPYTRQLVIPTYESLSNHAIALYEACSLMQQEGTDVQASSIQTAANEWIAAREQWELSEAFLYGPVEDNNIDPHIDSWPLDKNSMDNLLADRSKMEQIASTKNVDSLLMLFGGGEYGLLGFHAIEYLLYDDSNMTTGQVVLRQPSFYDAPKLAYLVGVARDLMYQTVALEACWKAQSNLSQSKQSILSQGGITASKMSDMTQGYAYYMETASSIKDFKTYQAVVEQIVAGCVNIADEVGNTKIGKPHRGSSDPKEGDPNYIESPYSLNSIVDFQNNIRSIQRAYMGVETSSSVYAYIRSIDADLAERCKTTIEKSVTQIGTMQEPFYVTAPKSEYQAVVTLVGTNLVDVLTEVQVVISNIQ